MTCARLRASVLAAAALAASPAFALDNWPLSCDWQKDVAGCFHSFHEGLALVPTGPLDGAPVYGYLDHDGNMAIAPRFTEAAPFANGLAAVKLDGKWGYVDKSGAFAIEPQYDAAHSFNAAGVAIVEKEEAVSLIDKAGTVVKRFPLGARYVEPANQAEVQLTPIEAPLAPVVWDAATTKSLSLPDGTMRVEPAPFIEDGVFVQIRESRYLGSWGLLGMDGAWIVAPEVLGTQKLPITDGKSFAVDREDGWQMVDAAGKPLNDIFFRGLRLIAPGTWRARTEGRTELLLDAAGNTLAELGKGAREIKSDETSTYFQTEDGVIIARAGGEVVERDFPDIGYAREQGDTLWIYDNDNSEVQALGPEGTPLLDDETLAKLDAYSISPVSAADGKAESLPLATLRPNDRNTPPAILTRKGEIVTRADWSDIDAYYADEGPLVVRADNDLYGAIAADGDWVVEPAYRQLASFHDGYALAQEPSEDDGLIVAADGSEHPVRRAVFRGRDKMADGILTYRERDPDTRSTRAGLWDIAAGKTVGEPKFVEIGEFADGFAPAKKAAPTYGGRHWGIIDRNGGWVIDPDETISREPKRLASGLYLLEHRVDREQTYALASPREKRVIVEGLGERPTEMPGGGFLVRPADGGALLLDEAGDTRMQAEGNPEDVTTAGNLAILTFRSGQGAVDASGAWRVPPRFSERLDFVLPQRVARAYDRSETLLVGADGEVLSLDADATVPIPGMNRYARTLDKEGETALIDREGKEFARIEGRYALREETGGEGLVAYRDEEARKAGFMDADGNKVIGPFFETLGPMSEGLAYFRRLDISGNRLGYLRRDGTRAMPAIYLDAKSFSEGKALVVDRDGDLFFIDKEGEPTIRFAAQCGSIIVQDADGNRTWPDEVTCETDASGDAPDDRASENDASEQRADDQGSKQ
ncbi:WG repeat-containing protein [Afifella sp. YEN Y35]|uniref:WG repeat-containing protein n=1 Tax=Afifella sp. YEN Y35 TaxID=3388337 RepID=UPI0039E1C055